MNRTDRFDDIVSDWLHADAEHRVPEHLDAVLLQTRTERQRPAWSSLERWLPMQTTLRLAPVPRVAWLLLVVGLVAALALAALAVGSRHRQPAPPFGLARNGSIVYGGTDNDIHTLDPVSGTTTTLITGVAGDHSPLLSPDGTRLLFLRDSATRDQGFGPLQPMIMVANDDGGDVRPLTGPLANFASYVGNAAWSHDGTLVAVISDVDSKPAIQVFTVDGSSPPVVIDTHLLSGIDYLAFRPGNEELTFRGVGPDGVGLFAVGSDGSGYRTIAHVGRRGRREPLAGRHEDRIPDVGRDPRGHPRRRRGHRARLRPRPRSTIDRGIGGRRADVVAGWLSIPVHQIRRWCRQPSRGRFGDRRFTTSRSARPCRTMRRAATTGSLRMAPGCLPTTTRTDPPGCSIRLGRHRGSSFRRPLPPPQVGSASRPDPRPISGSDRPARLLRAGRPSYHRRPRRLARMAAWPTE